MKKRLTTEEFIARAREVHGDKYDYSKVNYINSDTKVCIICSVHGGFWQTPYHHLAGNGCKKCAMKTLQDNRRMTTERFIERVKEIHGDKYDYSKLHYCRPHEEVCIICPEHGEFWQRAAVHLYNGSGCPKCGDLSTKNLQIKSTEQFVQECKKVHGDKYDYSKAIYEGANNNIEIICPIHGSFWQRAKHHEEGVGCPKCSCSHGELEIVRVLDKFYVEYESQYKILLNLTLFGRNEELRVDFFLPKENLIIEYNGIQHYEEVKYFHKKDNSFEKQKNRDRKLKKWCKDNGVKLLTIKYTEKDKIEEILKQYINFNNYERD